MPACAALLRGIAPSNPNMKNEKLRGVFERLGFDDVRSVISSGNILFETDGSDVAALEARIEAALTDDLGITSTTIIRTRDELRALVATDPFPGYTHGQESYLTATFLKHRDLTPARTDAVDPGEGSTILRVDPVAGVVCAVTDHEAVATPALMQRLERAVGKDITTRTWKTVERILAKL